MYLNIKYMVKYNAKAIPLKKRQIIKNLPFQSFGVSIKFDR